MVVTFNFLIKKCLTDYGVFSMILTACNAACEYVLTDVPLKK